MTSTQTTPPSITISASGSSTNIVNYAWTASGSVVATCPWPDTIWHDVQYIEKPLQGHRTLKLGHSLRLSLPDGSILHVDADGNFSIDDTKAQVIYKASRVREFSPHLNASDLLAKFIRYLGTLKVTQQEVLSIPIGLFINWLIIEAAEAYDDPVPEDVTPIPKHPLLKGRVQPRCTICKRFIRKVAALQGFHYCSPSHAAVHFDKLRAA